MVPSTDTAKISVFEFKIHIHNYLEYELVTHVQIGDKVKVFLLLMNFSLKDILEHFLSRLHKEEPELYNILWHCLVNYAKNISMKGRRRRGNISEGRGWDEDNIKMGQEENGFDDVNLIYGVQLLCLFYLCLSLST